MSKLSAKLRQGGAVQTPEVAARTGLRSRRGPARAISPADFKRQAVDLGRQLGRLQAALAAEREENRRLRCALDEVEQAKRHYEDLFVGAPAAEMVINASGEVVSMNSAARKRFRPPASQPQRFRFATFLSKPEIPSFLRHLRECILTREAISTRFNLRTRGGTVQRIQMVTVPCGRERKRPDLLHCMLLDDSDLRRLETEVEAREREVRSIVDCMQGIVWEADGPSGRRTFVGGQAERLLGYPVDQWLRAPDFWLNHIVPEDRDRVLNTMASAVAACRNYTCEYRMIAAGQRLVWIQDNVQILVANGEVKLRGISVDVTLRQQMELELQQNRLQLQTRVAERTSQLEDAVSELESFSYTLSHDLRAPLRSMHGFSEILLQSYGPKLDAEGQDYLRRIMSNAQRLDMLILDVLNYARINSSQVHLSPIDLDALVRAVVDAYPPFHPPQVNIEVESPLLRVIGHEGFLTQCISNLLSNAVKFVHPGTRPHIRVHTKAAGACARLWFEDNGIGIAPGDQQRIFRLFQRVHSTSDRYDGTGVGLAIVRRAAERMNGQVGLESDLGKGSKFWLQLRRG